MTQLTSDTPPVGANTPHAGGAAPRRAFNFNAGPATLPMPVLQQFEQDLINFQGMGAGILEISHRTAEFHALVDDALARLRALLKVPDNYRILILHGGGQTHFSIVPYNLMAYRPGRKAIYIETGNFAQRAIAIASRYGYVRVPASSIDTGFDRIPRWDPAFVDPEASYLHITTNNTVMGTRWHEFPDTGTVPLVGDMTSEILSREIDVSKFGVIYAGAQKNLAPPGLALAIVREDLLGHALPETPPLLNYADHAKDARSITNTPSTFAVYMMWRMLQWVEAEGGVKVLEARNEDKVARVYKVLDASGFYLPHAHPGSRSIQNVTFQLPTPELLKKFIDEARAGGLFALAGHSALGGVRASMYNPMTVEGAQALADFMVDFETRHG